MAKKNNTGVAAGTNSAVTPEEALSNEELIAEGAIDVLVDQPEEIQEEEIQPEEEEAPKEEAPKEEAPKEEAPKEEAPKEEAPKEEAKPSKEDNSLPADVIVINTSQNQICLSNGNGVSVTLAPKEFKRIDRAKYRELLKQKMVRIWFDKGILTSNADENETNIHGSEAPEELSQPVTSRDGGNSVSAEVTKFEKTNSVQITL